MHAASEFSEATRPLEPAGADQAAPLTGEEARRFARLPFRGRARAVIYPRVEKPGAEPKECDVLTTDLSRDGVSIMSRKRLVRGQKVLLVLSDSSRSVEVCWCCRVWAGLYAAGCRFTDGGAFPAGAGQG